jgi:hypothetical protein
MKHGKKKASAKKPTKESDRRIRDRARTRGERKPGKR